MDDAFASSAATTGLAALAATCERDAGLWTQRFAELFATRVLGVPQPLGREVAARLPDCAGATELCAVLEQSRSELTMALRNGSCVCLDLSAVAGDAQTDIVGELEKHISSDLHLKPACLEQLSFAFSVNHENFSQLLRLRRSRALRYPQVIVRLVGESQQNWKTMVRASYDDRRIMPVPAGRMPGRAMSVMPLSLFAAQAKTAWIILELNARYLGPVRQLRKQLATALRFADNLVDACTWGSSGFALDAMLNRRVAFHVVGVGDWLQSLHPAPADAVGMLPRFIRLLRLSLAHESARLAQSRGLLPELGVRELVDTLTPRYGLENSRRLVSNRCLRHQHILVMSPLALLPENPRMAGIENWLNLVPAIAGADAVSMYGKDLRASIGLNAWDNLLQQITALAPGGRLADNHLHYYS